jgi:hypothetical protein
LARAKELDLAAAKKENDKKETTQAVIKDSPSGPK